MTLCAQYIRICRVLYCYCIITTHTHTGHRYLSNRTEWRKIAIWLQCRVLSFVREIIIPISTWKGNFFTRIMDSVQRVFVLTNSDTHSDVGSTIKYSIHVLFYVFLNNFQMLINNDLQKKKKTDFATNFVQQYYVVFNLNIKVIFFPEVLSLLSVRHWILNSFTVQKQYTSNDLQV